MASIFRNTSPARRVARSLWATTTSTASTLAIIAGMTAGVTGFITCDCAADRVSLPGGLVPPPTADGPGTASVRRASARGS